MIVRMTRYYGWIYWQVVHYGYLYVCVCANMLGELPFATRLMAIWGCKEINKEDLVPWTLISFLWWVMTNNVYSTNKNSHIRFHPEFSGEFRVAESSL